MADLGDDGTLAAWLRAGRADAVVLRPDRVVMDVVPAGGHAFTDTATWASLLHTTRSPHPCPPTVEKSLLRRATR
ncbi:hypothetical protein ADK35_40945 [Streptomyces viridochromogenes]|nr:hypothetical protein ADK35_40945 [Streptomyces viridochromogenes]KOG09114.1 hypothetical protein ADK36_41680 [Streptomyces viridochromogenes]